MQGAKNKGEVPTGVVLLFCFVLLHHADDRNIQCNRNSQRSIGKRKAPHIFYYITIATPTLNDPHSFRRSPQAGSVKAPCTFEPISAQCTRPKACRRTDERIAPPPSIHDHETSVRIALWSVASSHTPHHVGTMRRTNG